MRRADILIFWCCALFLGVMLTPTGFYVGVWKLATGKDAAAWVQAFGSITAILAAVFIARADSRRQMAQAERGTSRSLAVFTELAFRASNAIAAAARATQGRFPVVQETVLGHEIIAISSVREAIDHLPLAQLDVPTRAVALLMHTQQQVIAVEGLLKKQSPFESGHELIILHLKAAQHVYDLLKEMSEQGVAST